jgi:single-stranded-DNA-specific exonuclease
MNYKILNKNFNKLTSEEFLEKILQQRGVENAQHLLNVSEKDLCDTMDFINIKEGLNLFDYWVSRDDCHIHIIYDCDADGITSGTYMYNYIKKVNPNINVTTSMNGGKTHGISIKEIPNVESINLLVVPDAGSSDLLCQNELNKKGIDILILDHHDFKPIERIDSKEEGQTIIINNQDGSYKNKTLSGVGVCYKFCKEYDKGLGINYADDDIDLVAIGLVGDSSDIRNYETRFLVNEGLENIKNELIKQILYKTRVWDKEEIKKVTIEDIGWKIAPQLNGTVREGTKEDRDLMLRAINGEQQKFEYQPKRKKKKRKHILIPYKKVIKMKSFIIDKKHKRKFNARKKAYDLFIDPKPPVKIVTLQEEVARIMYNIKTRQTNKINKYMKILEEEINKKLKENDKIIVINSSKVIKENTYTGIVANKLANNYKRPCLVLKEKKDGFGGSGRNYSLNSIKDLKNELKNLNIFYLLEGHPNSFGIGINKDKINIMKKKFNEIHKDMKIEDTYLCDFEILSSKLKYNDILEIAKLKPLWGGDISCPLFVLPSVIVKAEQITRHSNEKWNIIELPIAEGKKIKVYQMKDAGQEGYNKLLMRDKKLGFNKPCKSFKMDLIVKFDYWNIDEKNQYPYLQLVDYNIDKYSSRRF